MRQISGPGQQKHLPKVAFDMPATPPDSEDNISSDNDTKDDMWSEPTTDLPLPPHTSEPTQVLEQDKKTPDQWLARDPRLIRLTGVHPFNVEPPLSMLYDQGFLTSPELFFVRNHGHVPRVEEQDIPEWSLTVEGLVTNPLTITMRELLENYKQHTYPVTLVCAGNRRKEQNMVRKTKGFSWGAAGVSTSLFTGVLLADVLQRANPKRGARFLCMEGADRLPNGFYGTSVKLSRALDTNRGMMLAHKMNGERLRPDHGRPLRAVIPGHIGGRSVKWLKKIIITAEPSDNWYHIYDNRVLPTMISPEVAASEPEWWTDERYAIYDLSTNSAIAYPAHEERLAVTSDASSYHVRGYAYGGGGRRVTRVEVSLDKGRTWLLAHIDYAEDLYKDAVPQQLYGGTLDIGWREGSFCWCFWDIDVKISELANASDIVVRAMDESMNVQPRDMYWNVMGMMNNPWYRLAIHSNGDTLQFEHPTQPALMPGGWMERVKKEGGDLSNAFWGGRSAGEEPAHPPVEAAPTIKTTKDDINTVITIDEIRKHDGEDSPWFVIDGEVYDGTDYMVAHPGGAQSIISAAGLDSTDEFMAIHSDTAKAMLVNYHIGTLDDDGRKALSGEEPQQHAGGETTAVFLEPRKWKTATLRSKRTVSWDTRIFQFKLEHDAQTIGLPVGQHLMIRLRDPATREAIIRSYTPISESTQQGTLDVLVKVYFESPERQGGKMSMALDQLPTGHGADFKGPIGKFEYLGKGVASVNGAPRKVSSFYMICAGSGVTPIYSVLRAVMQDKDDPTKCVVLDGNRQVEDIMCRDDLDGYAAEHPERCKVLHTLTKAPDYWPGLKGRIATQLLKEHCARPEEDARGASMVLICGPEALEKSCHKALLEIGWKDDELLFF